MSQNFNHKWLFILVLGLLLTHVDKAAAQLNNFKGVVIEDKMSAESPLLVRAGITSALEVGRLGKVRFFDAPGMKAFYEARGFDPIWIKNVAFQRHKTKKIEDILKVLENSWTHGLNPNQYHVSEIRQMMGELKGGDYFQLDLVVSDALVRYGRDMSAMRVDPKSIGQRSRYWRKPLRGIDVLDYVSNHRDVVTAVETMAPQGVLYKKLQDELVRLYQTPAEAKNMPKVRVTDVIRPGTKAKAVQTIRKRMGLKAADAPQGASVYDDKLVSEVMAFQRSHGLRPDGIVGRQTAKLMNITRQDKIDQVLANLERLRWVEQNKPNRYIMVNVPSATLWAVENEKVVMEMPVVVGKPERATNIFSTKVSGIRYNPTWTVPPTIKRDDYLPKLRKNPYYLANRGVEIIRNGRTIDPGTIDWKNKTWAQVNAMRMVQGSGSNNPLGKVRFLMNNPFNIYLHDTTTKSYFKRADRALSSGCIRLEKPIELADFVLKPNANWSAQKRDAILKKGKLKEVYAAEPLPVYILYQTVWLGKQDQIIYGADLYGHDATLIKELKNIDGLAVPEILHASHTPKVEPVSEPEPEKEVKNPAKKDVKKKAKSKLKTKSNIKPKTEFQEVKIESVTPRKAEALAEQEQQTPEPEQKVEIVVEAEEKAESEVKIEIEGDAESVAEVSADADEGAEKKEKNTIAGNIVKSIRSKKIVKKLEYNVN